MILKTFISQYINGENVEDIIFHSGNIIFKDSLKTIIIIILTYTIFYVLQQYIVLKELPWIFSIIGIIIFIRYIIQIFNKGIDCIVLSKQGITFFAREGIRKYKTEFFGWETIETISHEQNTIRDKIWIKGDIKIQLDHSITYNFEQVNNPKKQVKKIMKYKNQYKENENKKGTKQSSTNDIEIISEALSDVIKEYLEKK